MCGRAAIGDIAVVVKFKGAVDEMSCKHGMDTVGKQPRVGSLSIGTISRALSECGNMVTAVDVFSTLQVLHIDNCGLRPRLTSLCRLLRPHKPLREIQTGLARLVSISVRSVWSRLPSKSRSFSVPVTIAGGQSTRKHTQYSGPISNGSICNPLYLEAYATFYQEAIKLSGLARRISFLWQSHGIHAVKKDPARSYQPEATVRARSRQIVKRQAVSVLD